MKTKNIVFENIKTDKERAFYGIAGASGESPLTLPLCAKFI